MSYFPEIAKNGLRFIINKISDSKKEMEIRLISDNPSEYENGYFDLSSSSGDGTGNVSANSFYKELNELLRTTIDSSALDAIIPTGKGNYVPLVNINYTEDSTLPSVDPNRHFFIIKLNKKLPTTFKKLSNINILILQSEIVKNEIHYAGLAPEELVKFGNPLEPDLTRVGLNKEYVSNDAYQSKNELTSSIPSSRLEYLLTGSKYDERLVDYRNFDNFIFFSSAEKRIENFKTKIEDIETHINNISESLVSDNQTISTTSAPATEIRKTSFKKINKIVTEFTDYEKWLYVDSQLTSTGSVPGLGNQYTDSSASLSLSKNVQQKFNYDGFDSAFVISGSSIETINILKDKYILDSYNFNNTTGSLYLSFLMKASGSVSDHILHRNTLTSSIPHYPMDSLKLETLALPQSTGSEYRRYIFKASGSHWIPDTSKPVVVGLNKIDFGINSQDIKVIDNNLFTSSLQAVGDYTNYATYATSSGNSFSGSFVPKGDLFALNITPTGDTNLIGVITDVKVTSNNPTNIKPFHNINSTSTTEFTNWYNGLISSASLYDSQNIQKISNNLPGNFLNDNTLNGELINYVDTIGEFYDEYKTLIDDYYRLFNKGYSDYKKIPSKYNKLLADHLGFSILPIGGNNFLDLFGLNDNLNDSKVFSDTVINNVLNNISYLYKTKGTENSIKALLNCYGLPSNVLKIQEGGVNRIESKILSNDFGLSGIGLFEQTGSIQFEKKIKPIKSIIISDAFDSSNFKFDWNYSGEITQSAIEAIFKMPPTNNTMSIFSSRDESDTRELWQLELYPSGSLRKEAKFRFRISPQSNGSDAAGMLTSSAFIDTEYIDVLDNNFVNIAVQKSSSGHDITGIHTYELLIGKSSDDTITFLSSSKLVVDGDSESTTNQNFISGSINNHLAISNNFTGSVAQIKSWSEPLKASTFKQHIYNKQSIVGNNKTGSTNELKYYYPLQEDYKSGSGNFTIIDASIEQKGGPIELDTEMFNSSSIHYDETIVTNFNFPVFGSGAGTLQYTDNMVSIEDAQQLEGNLNPFKLQQKTAENIEKHTRELYFSRSPQDIINDFIKDNLGNIDFNDLFADPRDEYKTTYPDLDNFNKELLKYNININMTQFINATNKIFNNSFIESVKKLIPVKASFNVGNTLKPTYTQRIKTPILLKRPDVDIVPEPAVTIENFEAPVLNGAPSLPPTTNFYGFQNANTSSLGEFEELNSYTHLINKDSNLNLDNNFREKLLNNPQKFWGTSSSDLHFKSLFPGIHNDYNTNHYEENCVFIGITDVEVLNNITSSKSGRYFSNPQHYTASKSFLNRKNIKTSQAVPERFLGITQQFVATSSKEFEYGSVLDSDNRIPTNHITYLQQPNWYGINGKGTKLTAVGTTMAPGDTLWNNGQPFSEMKTDLANNIEREWDDLATASFYRISTEGLSLNTLRVVRPDLDDTGTVG